MTRTNNIQAEKSKSPPEISVVLSTYNGSKYIDQQMNSFCSQTYSSWKLYVRDDGSTDNTKDILNGYKLKYPERINIISDNLGNMGTKKSFARLLNYVREADYIAFSDQDDIWNSNKLEILLNKIRETEGREHDPAAVFSDLEIVDENLKTISNSFFSYTKLSPKIVNSNILLFRNVVPGCSMMVNKKLISYIDEIPEQAVMHDYWIILTAHFLGKISYVNLPLVRYRQHEKNSLGAEKNSNKNIFSVAKLFYNVVINKYLYLQNFLAYINQLSEFYKIFGKKINNPKAIQAVLLLPEEKNFLRKKFLALKHGLGYGNCLMNLEFFLCC